MNPHIYSNVIFDKKTEINPGRKESLQQMQLDKLGLSVQKHDPLQI